MIDQLKYLNVAKGLCGPTSLCMLASAALGYLYTPADLYRDFPDIEKYRGSNGGFRDGLFKDKEIMEKLNLKLENEDEKPYFYQKAWDEGALMDSLEDGKRAIWFTDNKIFTSTGHYIELELKDGKIWLNDPNGANYMSMMPTLKNILDNGCDPEEFKKYGGRFYIFDVANSEQAGKEHVEVKSNKELMDEILKEGSQASSAINTSSRTRTVTTKSTEKVPEIPLYDQRLYGNVSLFGQGNLAEDGCGIFAYSETLQYLLDDPSLTPEKLAKMYEGTYSGDWGTSGKLFDETPQDYGLTVERCYPWEGWINTNKIQTALKNGQPVIAYVGPKTGLTGSGHYIVLTGMTEDGKVLVNDSNGANYEKSSLKDKYENGFDIETFSKDPNGGFWIFPSKESINKSNTNTKIGTGTQNNEVTETKPTSPKTPTSSRTLTKPTSPKTPTSSRTLTKPTTPTTPTKPTTPTEPKTPTTPTKPTTPTAPRTPTKPTTPTNPPTKPSINEPENTQPPVMQRTPEAILEAVQNIKSTENSSEYICNILHLSGFFTEQEMNTYKGLDISEICNQLEERGWNTITNSSELKSGDIIIVNNGEEIRVYAGNNSWYKEGAAELQQGNENWNENISWVAYRAN